MMFFGMVAYFTQGTVAMKYSIIGNSVHSIAVNCVMGVAMVIGLERTFGMLPTLLTTPANRILIFNSQILLQIMDGLFSCLICMFYAWMIFDINFSDLSWFSFFSTLVLTSISLSSIGVLVGSVGIISNNVVPIMNIIYLLLLMLCGVNIPLSDLPTFIRIIADFIPLTYGIDAVRAIINGKHFSSLLKSHIVPMLTLTFFYYFFGILLIKMFEYKSKVSGTFDRF